MAEQEYEFEVGQVVCLNSGGPPLTVTNIRSDGRVECVWFSGDQHKRETFEPATIFPLPIEDDAPLWKGGKPVLVA